MKILALTLALLALISCNKKDDDDDDDDGDTINTPDSKETLSSWNIGNGSFYARLDLNGANLSGTPFTMVFKYADNSEVQCTNTIMAGSEANGSYQNSGCSSTGGMATSAGGAVNGSGWFPTGGVGTYENNGTTLKLCRNSGGCNEYE
jgi:hypothetical protein